MSKTIWKYRLPRDGQTIEIHEHIVEVLHIGTQDGVPCLWAVVDPDRPREGYTEVVAWGTGWSLPDDVYTECDYWGSCEDWQGYVWHYFAEARFSDLWYADKVTTVYDGPYNSLSTESSSCPYSLTMRDGPTTATISLDNTKVNMDALINMVEQYVGTSNTATNNACR